MDKNMKKPKISVLMPVYNAEKFLKEAIDSILNQTFKNFELLIINDSSVDKSKKIILSYKDPRIRYFENKENLGVARTLNRGLKLTKGEYVARMDADDVSYPRRLEIEYNEIIKDNKVAIVASFYEVINENGKYLYKIEDAYLAEEIYYALQFRNCLGHPTVMFNKKIILDEFNGYQNREAEDYDLWLRVSKKYKIIKIVKVLHQLRISDSSRVAQAYCKISNDAILIARNNLQLITKKSTHIDIVSILANINPLNNSPQKIKKTLTILEKVNIDILKNCPMYLDKSVVMRCCENKKNVFRHYLSISTLFNSNLGIIFSSFHKVYLSIKYFFTNY